MVPATSGIRFPASCCGPHFVRGAAVGFRYPRCLQAAHGHATGAGEGSWKAILDSTMARPARWISPSVPARHHRDYYRDFHRDSCSKWLDLLSQHEQSLAQRTY